MTHQLKLYIFYQGKEGEVIMQTCDNCNNPNSTFCELENKKKIWLLR